MADRDPYLRGVGLPELEVPAEVAALLEPAIAAWWAEHQRMGSRTKLDAAEPIVVRWRWLAQQWRNSLSGGCADETGRPARGPDVGSWGHDHIDVTTAADRIGCSPQRVRQLLSAGELDGSKVGRVWVVEAASVGSYVRRRSAA